MYCENCGQQLESYMSYCPKCGTAINQKNLPNNNFYGGASINTKYENTVVFCNKCGKPLDYSYPNCLVCGVPNPVYKNKHNYIEKKSVNYKAFYIVNAILLILLLGISILSISPFNDEIKFASILYPIIFGIEIISYFYFICLQKLYIKADLPWWGVFIPIYNNILFYRMCTGNGLNWLIEIVITFICGLIIPLGNATLTLIAMIIELLIPIVLLFKLGRAYGASGLLTVLFSGIMIPVIAFSKYHEYEY